MKSVMRVELVCRGEGNFSPAIADARNTQSHSYRRGDYASAGCHLPPPYPPRLPAATDMPFMNATDEARRLLRKPAVSRLYGAIASAGACPGLAHVSGLSARLVTQSANAPRGG